MVDGRRVGEPASTIPQPLFFLLSHKEYTHSELFPLLQAVFPDAGIPRAGGQLAGGPGHPRQLYPACRWMAKSACNGKIAALEPKWAQFGMEFPWMEQKHVSGGL